MDSCTNDLLGSQPGVESESEEGKKDKLNCGKSLGNGLGDIL